MNSLVPAEGSQQIAHIAREHLQDFVTFIVKHQLFGIPVLQVQDILAPERIAPIPLAPPEVRGSINLRGRIVTVIDVRARLSMPALEEEEQDGQFMAVTVEHQHELYTLLVDSVGDVIGLSDDAYEENPTTLDAKWREFANGVYRLEKKLMIVLDVNRLLNVNG